MSEIRGVLPSAWSKFQWLPPLVVGVYLLYLLMRDAFLIIALILISHGVEEVLDRVDVKWSLVVSDYTITASKVVSAGDHGLLFVFMVLQVFNIIKVAIKDVH